RGMNLKYLDVGGGLGVNYDKGHLDEDAGINYSLQEYANAVVFTVKEVCDANDVPMPILVTESGRALTAHHSVLIVPVIGARAKDDSSLDLVVPEDCEEPVQALGRILDSLPELKTPGELLEAYHDAKDRLDEVGTLFTLGYVPLEERALAEALYWRVLNRLLKASQQDEELASSPDIVDLEAAMTDQYLCNFSVFQSMLDHWAIGQPFPVMPIDRLAEEPRRRGVLVDLTCDSDGKVRHYVSSRDNRYLPLHKLDLSQPYFLGFFLMGANEDIVGDAHNLFGRVAEAHVYADAEEPGNFWIEKIIPGTAVQDMLAQVQYFPN